MKLELDVKFNIGDTVSILDTNVQGKILTISILPGSILYEVGFFTTEYSTLKLFDFELNKPENNQMGFGKQK